ncbi:alsin isoform X3 [Oncorhynchus kisutch]|uniref:alsin isoform X3 n=1 Tax=Oncorhynchus kisutch TaxID=8019 RepID=UPI0012DBF00D|nr:alsin-like isoform X3 [Oncorhynchus kisutch]
MMEYQKSPVKEESSRERGLLHLWRGYSSSVTPERVLLSRPVLQAALGISHGILLAEGGLVYSFGDLTWRQGLRVPPTYPLLESVLSGQCVVSVAAGSFHCGAVTREGAVYMWGENSSGQCGLSERGLVPDASLVSMVDSEAVPPQIIRILEVTCGEQHTLALSTQHEVWAWGSGCQLGLVTSVFPVWRPQKVEHLAGRHVVQVACGGYHSLALVRRFPAQDSQFPRPTATDKCSQCNQLLFSMVDQEDHVIISHSHYCPLGIELADSKPGSCSRSRQASPARQASQSRQASPARQASLAQRHRASACPLSQTVSLDLGLDPDLAQDPDPIIGPEYLFPGDTDSSLRESGSKEQTNQEDTGTSDLQRQGPGTLTETDSNSAQTQARRKTSSSTDKKELKEYLKRTSDHILSEQNDNNNTGNPITLANQTTGDSLSLANQTAEDSLTLANETAEDSLTLASHSSGDLLTLVSHVPGQCLNGDLPDQDQPSTLTPYLLPQSTDDTTMASSLSCSLLENYTGALVMEHTLALTGRAASASPFEVNTPLGIGSTSRLCDSSKSEGCIPVAGLCEALSGPVMAYRKTNQEVRLCMEEDSLQGKKCSSLTDILLEEVIEGSRRHSLPPLLSHASPELPGRRSARSRPNVPRKEEVVESLPSLNTEVWSWGRGQEGQLGHGDQLPRLQPLCIKSLNGEEVVKVAAGTHHSLALSAQCQVFSWGSNRSGQLGHMNSPTTMPQQAKMSKGLRVWDLAAGQSHSVFLADGDCCQPILCYSGQQVMETTPENHIPGTGSTESSPSRTDTYTLRPVLLPFCVNMGYISSVYGGGQSCLAQADLNVMGFISALHELAAADRKYYCRLRDVNKRVVSPLLKKESVCTVLGQTSSLLFQSLASSYSRLCHLTGQHSVSLTAFLHTDRDVKGLVILKHANTFLDMYKEYCGSVGNFLVMGGFQALMKPSVECFGKKFEVLRQLSESSEDKVPLLDLLVLLFYSPMQHIHEYARLLLKLATCFDVSTVEYQRLQEGCSKYEALSLSLGRKRKEAETTNQFWRTYSGKTTDVLRNPQRRLVYESSNKSLTLQNAGRFSVNWFILFNDALIHAQGTIPSKSFFSSHHVYSLATLWVEPITVLSPFSSHLIMSTPWPLSGWNQSLFCLPSVLISSCLLPGHSLGGTNHCSVSLQFSSHHVYSLATLWVEPITVLSPFSSHLIMSTPWPLSGWNQSLFCLPSVLISSCLLPGHSLGGTNHCSVSLQFSSHHVYSLATLWVEPITVLSPFSSHLIMSTPWPLSGWNQSLFCLPSVLISSCLLPGHSLGGTNHCSVSLQFSSHHVYSLATLWVEPITVLSPFSSHLIMSTPWPLSGWNQSLFCLPSVLISSCLLPGHSLGGTNHCSVSLQFSSHHVYSLATLWVEPITDITVLSPFSSHLIMSTPWPLSGWNQSLTSLFCLPSVLISSCLLPGHSLGGTNH